MDKVLWCFRNWKPKALGTKIKNPLGPDNSKVSAHLRCIKVSYMRHFPIFTSFSPHKPCKGGWAGPARWGGLIYTAIPLMQQLEFSSVVVGGQKCLHWCHQVPTQAFCICVSHSSPCGCLFSGTLGHIHKGFEVHPTVGLESEDQTYG